MKSAADRKKIRRSVAIALLFSVIWLWLGPQTLTWRGYLDTASWAGLWFVPTTVTLVIVGIITLSFPNRFTILLFSLTMIPHLAVGLGFFPK